jgi:protoporphyrinogen oxidase
MTHRPAIVILGAGPAGLGAAYHLSRRKIADVTVLEQNVHAGGNAGSFEIEGIRVDYGSHRLHPACDREVLRDIRNLLGNDLLERPRHGRILMQGRWIHFPLRMLDLALRLPPHFVLGVLKDRFLKFAGKRNLAKESFASVLESGLGRTICRDFYFPYAEKIWGVPPEELAAIQAHRRISASSLTKILWKVLSTMPGLRSPGDGYFFYPKHGYGQISDAFQGAAVREGAQIHFQARVESILMDDGRVRSVRYRKQDTVHEIEAKQVLSTIPVNVLARAANPSAPDEVLQAASKIQFRGMILVYHVLEEDRFSEYDAHYFPEPEVTISRLSEPKIFSNGAGARGVTVLCAEIPCQVDGALWMKSDDELSRIVLDSLTKARIPVTANIRKVLTRRLPNAYPIYYQDYQQYFDTLDRWGNQIEGLLSFGRQGLFVHDNTHHALFMGYAASKCLDEQGHFDRVRWREYRKMFETHVVED